MVAPCIAPVSGGAFLTNVLQLVDCQAQTIGASGYQALANPSSSISLALTALITIFIALFGVRMLFGHAPAIGEVVIAALKIGVVLMLATSWDAYRVVAYDVVLRGPSEIVKQVGGASALPGATGGLVERLQQVDNAVVAFTNLGSGQFDSVVSPTSSASSTIAPTRTPVSDDLAFGAARLSYLIGIIGAFGFLRLVAGLLLALAPLFAGLLLFEPTRGFFLGWLRMLVACMLGAVGVTIVVSVELSIIEPWLSDVLALRAARYATPAAPVELLVITAAFSAVMAGVIFAAVRTMFSLALPTRVISHGRGTNSVSSANRPLKAQGVADDRSPITDQSRALLIAESVGAAQRREQTSLQTNGLSRTPAVAGSRLALTSSDGSPTPFVPLGRGKARTVRHIAGSSSKRDLRR